LFKENKLSQLLTGCDASAKFGLTKETLAPTAGLYLQHLNNLLLNEIFTFHIHSFFISSIFCGGIALFFQ